MEEGTEGEIAKEIEVKFMSSLDPSAKFYAFQMPEVANAKFDETLEIQFEEETNKFEMELPIASTTPGMEWMDTQPLTTVSQQAEPKRFAVGFLSGNCLRVYYLKGVITLQPLFSRKKQKVLDLGDRAQEYVFSEPNEGWFPLIFHDSSSKSATLCRLAMKGHSCKDDSLAMTDRYEMLGAQAAALRRGISLFLKQTNWCTFKEIEDYVKDDNFSASAFSEGYSGRINWRALKEFEDSHKDENLSALASPNRYGDPCDFADYPESCPNKLRAIVDELVVVVHGACFPKASTQHPDCNEFRYSVLILFADKAAGAKLTKDEICGFAEKCMGGAVGPKEFEAVMEELCEFDAVSERWLLRTDH